MVCQPGASGEITRSKTFVEFLGYRVSLDAVGIRERSVRRIKSRISYILYHNLIQPIRTSPPRAASVPSNSQDPDFLTAIMQIRRYLYGNLSERQIALFSKGHLLRLRFKGLMNFYPMMDDRDQMIHLDGWLLSTIYRCLKRRGHILARLGFSVVSQLPFNLSREELLEECSRRTIAGKRLLVIPSFLRVFSALRFGLLTRGIAEMADPRTLWYGYEESGTW